jgi:hypothetical protein
MADKKIQLKRNNASTIDNLFPVVRITDAVGSDGTTSFLDGGKIRPSYLPSTVFDSLYNLGGIAANVNLWDTAKIIIDHAQTNNRNPQGYYLVSTGTRVLTGHENQNTPALVSGKYYLAHIVVGDEGQFETGSGFSTTTTLEAGDWVFATNFSGLGTEGSPYILYFAVVENTYENASTTVGGIVTLSNASNVNAFNGTTNTGGLTDGGSKVITENNLFDMMGTTSGTIARGDHLHTDVYEPHNDGLTDLAGLLTTGATGFVRINGVNDASLDTNTYLNASTTSTQAGYFGNIHLQDDINPSHYLGITTASDLTAARTLSLDTGDANRTIKLRGDLDIAGNFTTSTAAVTINATAGGSTLGLPTSISFPALLQNGVLFASANNTVGQIASTTIGRNLLQIADLSAVAYARFNADETISMLDAASFRSAIGAGTSSTTGTVTNVATDGLALTGGPITTTGTITHSTADGYKHVPTTGTSNDRRFLVAGSTAGSFAWEAFPRTFYDTTSGTISGDIIFDEVA